MAFKDSALMFPTRQTNTKRKGKNKNKKAKNFSLFTLLSVAACISFSTGGEGGEALRGFCWIPEPPLGGPRGSKATQYSLTQQLHSKNNQLINQSDRQTDTKRWSLPHQHVANGSSPLKSLWGRESVVVPHIYKVPSARHP